MKRFLNCYRFAVFAMLATAPAWLSAQPTRINVATFNVGWWISDPEFKQVVAQCSEPERSWCDPRSDAQCRPVSSGLPPCNAYTEYHSSGVSPIPRAVFSPTAHYWDAKRLALEQTLRSANPDVLGFQEISGEAAARAALGRAHDEYSFCTSNDRDVASPEVQRLVIAVRKNVLTMASCETDFALAVEDMRNAGHFTRPALIASLVGPAGHKIRVANVHLKSGCASPAGDANFDFRGAYLDSTENTNCPTLRKQIGPLERLIERESIDGAHLILLGDFNRKLDLELNRRKAGNARAGSSSATGIPVDSEQVRLLWPEVNDGDPTNSELTLMFREPRSTACARNEGLDHIALSQGLAAANRGARTREVELAKFAGRAFAASDHCPLVLQLNLP
ncbi:endonuclease/exonuclease/phosphatase family protein [Acidovorax sp. D2M1]|uniref:Endonuclease/exonuclease/phosphatase family protein n=1 Tax=Acidovorax benzenivorans TaxID=2987520 RepID=A0ABT5RZU6_9BURK|nr:endonuclease/exonuclease/phosphatase family protein [Acidovorax benzenivorans]MDD2179219.1 endonuclease/exonuclease/phosphatase family protein [Acidovorax benzenivorans]